MDLLGFFLCYVQIVLGLLGIVVVAGLVSLGPELVERFRWVPWPIRTWARNRLDEQHLLQLNHSAGELERTAARKGFHEEGLFWMSLIREEAKIAGSVKRAHETLIAEVNSWSEPDRDPRQNRVACTYLSLWKPAEPTDNQVNAR